MNSNLAWDDFRLIKAIADHDGLTGAANALGVNHSTVFRRLGQIEEQLGLPLFERRKTGYVATVAGTEMAALANRMDEDVTAFGLRLAGRDVAPSGEVRVTTTDTLYLNVLLPIFAAFRLAHPLIRLDIVIGNQTLNLSKRDADVAIRANDSPGETLVGRRLATLNWAIYGRAGDELTPAEQADPKALFQRDWVALGDQLGYVKAARYVRERVAPERIALKSSAVLGMTEAVEQGLGIGPLPCFIADQRPGLVRLMPPDPEFSTGLWILTHPDIRHAPRVRAFMDFCGNELAKKRGLIEGMG
ncbi:LysR family transcriptional regulator [Bosea psychrotolerans]|uniref:LysR family transcriptional regulator n=1 Tax=Bosea psychrotolerans TaxID=1871628 RepID=A0A2S4LZW1_9HYPH|nr:LysR family transcriptional regulator [Bosea psychrotolerans]POR48004.1 LysR family transcriptional regulator [Bosea psychrotolerans]